MSLFSIGFLGKTSETCYSFYALAERSSKEWPIPILLTKQLFIIMHRFDACRESVCFYKLNALMLIQLNTIAYGFGQHQAVEVFCVLGSTHENHIKWCGCWGAVSLSRGIYHSRQAWNSQTLRWMNVCTCSSVFSQCWNINLSISV